jgi:hypothetical protein
MYARLDADIQQQQILLLITLFVSGKMHCLLFDKVQSITTTESTFT